MNVEGKLRAKITLGYIVILIVGISMAILLLHERKRMQQIETETEDIRHARLDINAVHHRIATLAILGESVIGWKKTDSTRYPPPAHRQPAASPEAPLSGLCTPNADRHAPLPPGGQGNPPAAHHGGDGAAERSGQPTGKPPARSGPAGDTCPYHKTKEKRAGRFLRRQEDRTNNSIRQRTAPVQRQPDCPATETGGGDGCIYGQPAHTQ